MKTAAIAYRVSDFLCRYPPFQYLRESEVLELVAGGKVAFHEDGEIVFAQGQPRSQYVYVVQQGVVRLVETLADGSEALRDVRGEGDLLGIGRYLGIGEHIYTARTGTDVILYALPADRFWEITKRHPRASRFLGAYFSATITPSGLESEYGRNDALRLGRRPLDWMWRRVHSLPTALTCTPHTPAREAARLLATSGLDALTVVDPQGAPLGLISVRCLSDMVASGALSPEAPAHALMETEFIVAAAEQPAGAYMTRMLDCNIDHLVLTADGSAEGPLVGLLDRRALARAEGAEPLTIVEDMARAAHISELGQLLIQGEATLSASLTGPESIRWLAPIAAAFQATALRRIVALVEGALAQEGVESPDLEHCWVFFGSAGRTELLTRHDLDHGLVYEEPPQDLRREARGYFLELGRRVSVALGACGFGTSAKAISSGHPSACRSVAEWERAFTCWISDPVESCVYRATSFFDLRPIHGDCRLVERLERHIHGEEGRYPAFVPLLVSDSMANLPPLTFFRGLVIDDDGAYTEVLDLQRATLQPVVDIARALALDGGIYRHTATLERLQALAPEDDEAAVLIEETANAFRNALYHRARTGLTSGSDGSRVDPAKLTRLEQNLLKAGFRTVLRLMEYMGRRYGVIARR